MKSFYTHLVVCLALLAISNVSMHALDKDYYAPASKLAEGKWVKIAVMESGIYQITAEDVASWGLDCDLSQIHIFGYGGAPLSETMLGDNYADDLPQVPVVRSGDRILFYAQGPTTWDKLNDKFPYVQVQHPYANSGCYLVTNDARYHDIDIAKADNGSYGPLKNTYIERLCHERDIINLGKTGRTFLGESFAENCCQTFNFDLNGLVNGSMVMVYPVFAAKTIYAASTLNYSYNGTPMSQLSSDIIPPMYGDTSRQHFKIAKSLREFTLDDTDKLSFQVDYSCPGTVIAARLDFITVNYERQLALKDGGLAFGLDKASPDTTYQLAGCTGSTRVWDVTCPFALVQQNITVTDGIAAFSPAASGRREFIAFDASDAAYAHPVLVREVANQNIHGQATPDMIILAPAAYLEQARRVATLHEQYDGFRVLVLDHETVFNEFSSGTQDAMAYRRLCKMFYDRGVSDDGHRLQYLLLLGGGSYDNRMIGTDASLLDYPKLLTWQSEYSSDEDGTFTTDDFFAMLDDGSGINPRDAMNIAVGRMIVRSEDEARTVVDKLEKYITQPDYGYWKNRIMYVADDENLGVFMEQSNAMIENARSHGGEDMAYSYVYIDAFDAVNEGGQRTYPAARDKMYSTLNEGVLWWNYNGHASPQQWTSEGLLTSTDVENLLNYSHLPVLYTSSCEFGRFDNATVSSGERIFLNPNGGAIAVITPARLAYVYPNGPLNNAVARYIFAGDESGRPKRIGDIIRLAKNDVNMSSDNKLRFLVFGDPAMRLAYAPMTARIETINGKAVDAQDTEPMVVKPCDTVEFGGKIIGLDGKVATDFDGAVISTLYGPEQSVTTHGYGGNGKEITYDDRPGRLAITMDTVVGGEFTVRVTIPSEVNGEYDNFRPAWINLYAYDSRNKLEAKGSNSDFYIYGDGDVQVTDTIGPDIITMALNDESFVDGSEVSNSPLLLVTVADDSGVDFSAAGSEHCMTLTLDGTTIYSDLVNYYTPLFAERGTLGSISYQLSDLPEGSHTLSLRVWDVCGNLSEKTITFNVTTGGVPEIAASQDVDVYSEFNGSEATFYVSHNSYGAMTSVTIEVYELMGRPVWRTTQSVGSGRFNTVPVTWNLLDGGGRRVSRGIYVYRATITTDGKQVASKSQKLAVPAS